MNAFLFIFSGMLFLWLYQSNKFMVISYNNAKTIQVNTIAHKIVPACVVVAICLGTLIWQEVRHLTHSIRSSEFTRLCFKATHLVLLLLLHRAINSTSNKFNSNFYLNHIKFYFSLLHTYFPL